jgi:hypothetical protein
MTFKNCQTSDLLRIFGGADRDRTDDLLNAIQALSQLSYGPTRCKQKQTMKQAGCEAGPFS